MKSPSTSFFNLGLATAFLSALMLTITPHVLAEEPAAISEIEKDTIKARSSSKLLDRIEAFVNTAVIFRSDISRFRQLLPLRAQLDPMFQGTPVSEKGEKASDTEIIDFLVDEAMIAQQFTVTDAEVEQEINSIQSKNRIDRPGLRAALKEQGFEFVDYFELLRMTLAKRNLIDRDIRIKVSVTDDDVKNYYLNHYVAKAGTDFSYSIQMIAVNIANYKSQQAAFETAERALTRIKAGESFEEIAKSVSDDPSKEHGGDLGYMSESQMNPLLKDTVKKMKIGDVSSVVGGAPGSAYVIIKLVNINTSGEDQFNRVKGEIYNQLLASEYLHQVKLWIERTRQSASVHRNVSVAQ